LLLVTLAGGYLFTQSPLKSFRPFHESLDTSSINIDQQVPARLWQDPLEAVIKYTSKDGHFFIQTVEMRKEIQEVINDQAYGDDKGTGTAPKLTVLISTLDDSPYSEGRETRIRVRYAVGAALDHVCYVPESSESVGLMTWTANKLDSEGKIIKEVVKGKTVDKAVLLEVPFEWYRKRKVVTCAGGEHYPGRLLVLWVKSSDIDKAPLHYLSQLVTVLVPELPKNQPSPVSIKLLGPWGSDALRVMMKSAKHKGRSLSWAASQVELLSPWATADPLLLLGTDTPWVLEKRLIELDIESARGEIASYFKNAGIDWTYSVGSDRDMIAHLGEELDRREIDIGSAKIAVVSEWDTFYGRMLPLEFRATAVCKRLGKGFCSLNDDWRQALNSSRKADAWLNKAQDEAELKIDRYTYMRGLDGETAHEQRPTASKSRKPDQDSIYELWKDEQSIASLERPDGPSQYDYVRRLSAQLKEGETQDNPYVAIGVLGSDPYDKLLILQALKDEFPSAIFFTTDLDARFLHPSQQSWARNLIIASPFGLRLNDHHQRDIPPFRDSYQSAAYHALITSLTIKSGGSVKAALPQGCLEKNCIRLFEVGRTQFIDLSQHPSEPHPDVARGPSDPVSILVKTLVGIFLACVLIRWASPQVALAFGTVGTAVLIGLALCWRWANDPLQEPFFWAEGVSIWPTELVRVLAAALTIYLIWTTVRSLIQRKAEIVRQYVKDSNDREDQFDFPKLWKKHDQETKGCQLFCRVLFGVVVAVTLSWLIFDSFERPFVPARGTIGFRVDFWVLLFAVLFLYVLLLLVAYLCIACSKLLDDLRTHRVGPLTGWGQDPSMPLPRAILNNVFAIRMSADYTVLFASFAPYPLYVLFLMIVSRNGYFDHWTFPPSLIIAYFIMFGLLAFSSMKLWSRGNKLRGEVLGSLQEHLATAQRQKDTVLAANIERIIQEVASLKKGVYGTWREQPVWSTILYPLGGVTILSFLDFMSGR